MIDKINNNQIQDHLDGSAGQPGRAKPAAPDQTNATLQTDFERLIEQATKIVTTDNDAVQRAKQLLESGQLDNPANIKEAAQNIIKLGI